MNERVKTIVFAVASLAMLGAFLWVIAQYQGAWAEEEEEPISEPVIAEPTVDTSEDETMPEIACEDFTEPYEEPVYYEESCSDGLTAWGGVYYYGDRKETWYSSNVSYHKDTADWWLDEEGCYRTDEGYYVVAASDMEYGTVFEGSKGMCQVLDCGCAEGTTDYYVRW